MVDLVIVGAGTAGLSAAIYGTRAGKTVLVLEASTYGGQIVPSPQVENYPGIQNTTGFAFAQGLYEQAIHLGTEVQFQKVIGVRSEGMYQIVVTEKEEIPCRAIILAPGTQNRKLGFPQEEQWIGKGISYCATCDGMFYKNKTVAVAGGGNTALEDVNTLSQYCEKVYLIHRRDTLRAEQQLIKEAKEKENITFLMDTEIKELLGHEKLEGLRLKDKKTGELKELKIAGLFVAIGQIPQNKVFSPPVELDEDGYMIAGEDCRTNVKGIYAAGDARTKKVRQLSTAAADGAVAALGACESMTGEKQQTK